MGNPFGNSSGSPPSAQQTSAQVMQDYINNIGAVTKATNEQYLPTSNAQLAAIQASQGGYNQQNLNQLQQFSLPTAQVGQQVANSNSLAGANTNVDLLNGPGTRAAIGATTLSNALNPTQAANQRQATNLVNSINLNGLSGGEQAAVERSLNQSNYATGNLGIDNATNTVSNAMKFGQALQDKRNALGNALNTGVGVATAQNVFANPVGTALGTGQTNQGSQFANSSGPTSSFAGMGQGLLGSLTSTANAQLPLQAQSNYQNSAQGSYVANMSSCCFIFMEIHNGILPWYVRVERDKYYALYPDIASGYKRMAKWLVPLMKNNIIVRSLVNWTMVKPLTMCGANTHKLNSYGWIFNPIRLFWFNVWKLTAK